MAFNALSGKLRLTLGLRPGPVKKYGTLRKGFGAKNKASSIVDLLELLGPSRMVIGESSRLPLLMPLKFSISRLFIKTIP